MRNLRISVAILCFVCLLVPNAFADGVKLDDRQLDQVYAGQEKSNVLTLSGQTQVGLSALSNINSVYSADSFQSNITANKLDVVNNNEAIVTNEDQNGENMLTYNTLLLTGQSQKDLRALSNLNAVDSAAAIQSTINYNDGEAAGLGTATNNNFAIVNNRDPVAALDDANNTLLITDESQNGLFGLSNVNAVDSAVAVQSIISVNKDASISNNYAEVTNSDAENTIETSATNTLIVTGDAQKNMTFLSNLNLVDTAKAVQFNINANTDEVAGGYSEKTNTAIVQNIDVPEGIPGLASAQSEVLLLPPAHQTTIGNNTLVMSGNAQTGLSALFNLDIVDSAVAAQSNVTVNKADTLSSNEATVSNQDNSAEIKEVGNLLELLDAVHADLNVLGNIKTVDSASAVQSNITANLVYEPGSSISSNLANVYNDDGYDLTRTATNSLLISDGVEQSLVALSNLNAVDAATAVQSNITVNKDSGASSNQATVENLDNYSRDGGVATNTLLLSGSAQSLLQALSNVNSVDSAVAVQSSITLNTPINPAIGSTVTNNNDAEVKNKDEGSVLEPLELSETTQSGLSALSNVNSLESAVGVQSNITANMDSLGGNAISINSAYVYNGPSL